jgi:hypothetical protein
MSAKGNLGTRGYTGVSFFDVMSSMIFGVFVSNSENIAARSVECVCYKSCLAKTYRKSFPNFMFC